MKVVICSAKNSITDACSTADCLVNLVERMKRQRMKGQRMKRQRMKMQQMKRQRMKRQRMKTVTDWPKCFCIYRFKCSKAISGWMVGWLSDCTFCKSTCDANNIIHKNLLHFEKVIYLRSLAFCWKRDIAKDQPKRAWGRQSLKFILKMNKLTAVIKLA